MQFVNICEEYKEIKEKQICIFGAGKAGAAMFSFLKMHGCRHLFVMDNNADKHGMIENDYEIGSFGKSLEVNTDIYLVGFLNNDTERLKSAIEFLDNKKVPKAKIKYIDFSSSWVKDFSAEYTEHEFKCLNINKKEKKNFTRIVLVGTWYNEDSKKRVSGGTNGAVNMQRSLLENQYKGAHIECMLFPKTWKVNFEESFNRYEYVLCAARFLAFDAQRNDAVYIANDIYSAYALSRYGQRYVLLYHGQGDYVSDLNAFDAQLTNREKEFVTYVEKEAIRHSYKTFFPSKGARLHFLNTIEGTIDFEENAPLYNSIYDFPEKEYRKRHSEADLNFFSIGQMTRLKGMDRIPDFLNRVRKCTGKKICWIVVADGELKDEVKERMKNLNARLPKRDQIEYEIMGHTLGHQKIYQLMAESDVYLMLHRISIFDFSTLEAMYMEKPIILSDIAGNDEFNLDNNIFLVNENTTDEEIKKFIAQREQYGEKNHRVYDLFFSKAMFRKRYYEVFDELLEQ